VTVIVYDEDPFNGPPHSKIFIVVLQALETSGDRGILLGLCFLGAGARNCRLRLTGGWPKCYLKVKLDNGYL